MSVYRKWYCTCTGHPVELSYEEFQEEDVEIGEPVCEHCGASPSSDPRKTVIYRDVDDWED